MQAFTFSNPALKARIYQDPRPGYRGACIRAYVAIHQAMDAEREGDPQLHKLKLLEAQDWIQEARAWDVVEVVTEDLKSTVIRDPDQILLLRTG